MSYKSIPIPGGGTHLDDRPMVEVVSEPYVLVKLIIRYNCSYSDQPARLGELLFSHVLQYRWTYGEIDYDDFPSDATDYTFGLIEIIDSPYIVDIIDKTEKQRGKDKGIIYYMNHWEIHHFRIAFDEYGQFDILCTDVLVREIEDRYSK